ncbi:MAG: TolC family protein [Saprospiraceae bacterium]|nr:TolC family protein [Saprospiraceae bacterium]
MYKSIWLVCLLLGLCGPIGSLNAQTVRPLSLPEALHLALENSATLQKARLDRQAVDVKIRERRSANYPQISGTVHLDYVPQRPTEFWPSGLFGGPDDEYLPVQINQLWQTGAVVNASQTLLDVSAIRMAPAAEVSRNLSDLALAYSEEEVIYHTATLFYQILQTEQLLQGLSGNLEKIDDLRRMAELQLENGYAIPTDVKRIRVAQTNLETQQKNLLTTIDLLKQNLQFLCNLPLSEPMELAWEGDTPAADSLLWQNIELDLESSTAYKMLENRKELHEIQSRSQYGQNFPKLSAYAAAGIQTQQPAFNFINPDSEWYGLAMVGFKLDVPIFNGFLNRRKSNLLKLEGQKLELERDQVGRAKKLEFNQAYSQYRSALNMLHTQEDNVALARDISDKLFLQYKEGVAPLTDLLNAQTALSEAETHYWRQVFDYRLAVLKLLKAAGRLETLK